jgi:hypothetical protein
MTIEDIYFPKSKDLVNFDNIVREIANLITHFTVDTVIATSAINRSLAKGDGLKDGRIHSKGSEFEFQEFRPGSEFIFEIKFEGEDKRFRITFEVNGSSPNGILTYMVEPDGGHALFSKVKSFLKSASGGNSDYIPIAPSLKNNPQTELEETREEVIEISKKQAETKVQKAVVDISPLPIPEGRRCACPTESDKDVVSDARDMAMYSTRFRKLYYKENSGFLGLYLCEHCGTNLLIEKRDLDGKETSFYQEIITKETSEYLTSMDAQLDVIIEDKGVQVVREMILGGAKL